jgi:hypothetical protein
METGFDGQVVLEINSRGAGSRSSREDQLAEALDFARTHLGQRVQQTT